MKKLILFAFLATITFAATAQTRVTYQMILDNAPAYSTGGNMPLVRNVTTHRLETLTDSTVYFRTKSIIPTSARQTAASAHDTVLGKALTVVTASRLDTLTFRTSLYASGQVMDFICTNAANDSTYVKTTSGNINGASTYWLAGTYKAMRIYFDGTNYWILNKQ